MRAVFLNSDLLFSACVVSVTFAFWSTFSIREFRPIISWGRVGVFEPAESVFPWVMPPEQWFELPKPIAMQSWKVPSSNSWFASQQPRPAWGCFAIVGSLACLLIASRGRGISIVLMDLIHYGSASAAISAFCIGFFVLSLAPNEDNDDFAPTWHDVVFLVFVGIVVVLLYCLLVI